MVSYNIFFRNEHIFALFIGAPNNADGGYSAEIKHLRGIKYEAVLYIKNVSKDIESKTIYMLAKENIGGSDEAEDSSPK